MMSFEELADLAPGRRNVNISAKMNSGASDVFDQHDRRTQTIAGKRTLPSSQTPTSIVQNITINRAPLQFSPSKHVKGDLNSLSRNFEFTPSHGQFFNMPLSYKMPQQLHGEQDNFQTKQHIRPNLNSFGNVAFNHANNDFGSGFDSNFQNYLSASDGHNFGQVGNIDSLAHQQSNFQKQVAVQSGVPFPHHPGLQPVQNPSYFYEQSHEYAAGWTRKRVTPVGLKEILKKEVDEKVQAFGVESGNELPTNLNTALKSNNNEGDEEVTTQVHKKFLIAANRYYMGSSKYKGVCYNKKKQKWRARISNNGKREFLGDWDSEVEAALIYDARVKQLFGSSDNLKERLNFPDGLNASAVQLTQETDVRKDNDNQEPTMNQPAEEKVPDV